MDLDRLLARVSEEAPSGAELRNDHRFHAIERLVDPAARDSRLNGDGSVNLAAPNVDWARVMADGHALAGDGRDLRLLTILVRGAYAEDGFAGLGEGLSLLTRSIAAFWDDLHPRLRDRDDAAMATLPRTNALKQLENDDNGLLGDLRFGMVLNPRGIGALTGDDLARALLSDFKVLNAAPGGLSQSEKDAIVARHGERSSRVKAATRAMADEQPARLDGMIADLGACLDGIGALEAAFNGQAGFGDGPGLSLHELTAFLTACRATLKAGAAMDPGQPVPGDSPEAPAPAAMVNGTGAIGSRHDVETALDRIVAFYERTEPGSPIPHLARRMRRMVSMDFLELMEEIAPSGLKEFRTVAGVEDAKKK